MKVALVILHSDPKRGGAERYTVDLAAGLFRRGHDVSLVATDAWDDAPKGYRSVALKAAGVTRRQRYLRFLESLDEHCARERYDVLHAMLPVRTCDLYHPHAGLAAEALETGHLKHPGHLTRELARVANRLNVKRRTFAAVERELLTRPDPPAVLCLSDYVKQTVRKHFPALPPDRLETLFNAVDLKRFDPARDPAARAALRERLGIAPSKVVALIIAQDFARKGLREAIEAVAQLRDERVVLVVVGKQSPEAYRGTAEQLGVAGRVIFAGSTPDPYPFYAAADLFVLPTRHDPCSLVVLEALAMGVPVVSTVFNGACEIMTDGQHGFVLRDPSDVPALASAMARLTDDGFRSQCAHACGALRARLSLETHLANVERLYLKYGRGVERQDARTPS